MNQYIESLEGARKLLNLGIRPIPVEGKVPTHNGVRLLNWQNLLLEESDLPTYFNGNQNVGG